MSRATENEKVVVGFRDHDRQRYAPKVPIADAGEFNIGCFREDGFPIAREAEFRVTLVELRSSLLPHVEAFGEGVGALRRAIDLGCSTNSSRPYAITSSSASDWSRSGWPISPIRKQGRSA